MLLSRSTRRRAVASAGVALALLGGALTAATAVEAAGATTLTIEPLGWNIVGLDSNDETSGPDTFPIGARVCNTGAEVADVDVAWSWTSENIYISIVGATSVTVADLAASACQDVYFPVKVERNDLARLTARGFLITATSASAATVTTPANREIYVENLISQGRNTINSIVAAPEIGVVGDQVEITVIGSTSPGGYEQLTAMVTLDPSIFRVDGVTANFDVPTGFQNDQFYADACGWFADTTDVDYLSCPLNPVDPVTFPAGKVGGNFTYTVKATVVGVGSTTVLPLLYDFSGSSFHYDMNGGVGVSFVAIDAPTITKTDTSDPVATEAGDTITYDIVVTNTSGVALQDVTVTDANATIGTCTPAIPVAELADDATITCEASHVVTQQDVDAGQVLNTATLQSSLGQEPLADIDSNEVVTTLTQSPAMTIAKADTSATAPESAGDVVEYEILLTNTGNVTLENVTMTDANATIGSCTPSIPVATVAPDATVTCTATHVVTQADIDAGQVLNTAVASASFDGQRIPNVTSNRVVTPLAKNAAIEVVKTDVSESAPTAVGQVIVYEIVATNTGNVTLHDVDIVDDNAVLGRCTPAIPVASLAPGASITCTAEHTVTEADLAAGKVDNTAIATSDEVVGSAASNLVTTLLAAAPVLPATGGGDGSLAWLAAALLAAGAALVATSRRRITR